jgi:hypothetical protein
VSTIGGPVINVAVPLPEPVSTKPKGGLTPPKPRKPPRPASLPEDQPAGGQDGGGMAPPPLGVPMKPPVRAVIMPWTPDDRKATRPTQITMARVGRPLLYAGIPAGHWYHKGPYVSHADAKELVDKAKAKSKSEAKIGVLKVLPEKDGSYTFHFRDRPVVTVHEDDSHTIHPGGTYKENDWRAIGGQFMQDIVRRLTGFALMKKKGVMHHADFPVGTPRTHVPQWKPLAPGTRVKLKIPEAEGTDWRPNESLPEDFYAMSRRKFNRRKIVIT